MLNRAKMHDQIKSHTPPATPRTPDSLVTGNTPIISLQSLISHHYLSALKPLSQQSLTSQSFVRKPSSSAKQNNLSRHFLATSANNSIIIQNSVRKRISSANNSENNDLFVRTLSDFNFNSGSLSQLNNTSNASDYYNDQNSSQLSSPRKKPTNWKPTHVPKYLADENEKRKKDAVKTKKDIHNKIIG